MSLKTQPNKYLLIYKNYRENIFVKIGLLVMSFFYYLAYISWRIFYKTGILKTYKLPKTVISIGNITAGGTGKTPIVIELANYLVSKGHKVAVLSRGYKRTIKKNSFIDNILVSDGNDVLVDHEISGDEPNLIANKSRKSMVLVGNDRINSGKSAIKLGANIIILDDGFQQLRLSRDENILLLDGTKPFDNKCLLPAGYLREPISSIKRASAIIISNSKNNSLTTENQEILRKHAPNRPILFMSYKIKAFKALNLKKTINPNEMPKQAIAFCGIGNPVIFFEELKALGIKLFNQIEFNDHHKYIFEDLESIADIAQKHKIENVITTEKDAVKINELCQALPLTFWATEIEIIWNSADPFEEIFVNKDRWERQLNRT